MYLFLTIAHVFLCRNLALLVPLRPAPNGAIFFPFFGSQTVEIVMTLSQQIEFFKVSNVDTFQTFEHVPVIWMAYMSENLEDFRAGFSSVKI